MSIKIEYTNPKYNMDDLITVGKWLDSSQIDHRSAGSEHLSYTTARHNRPQDQRRYTLHDPYMSWQVPRGVHNAPALH